MTVLKVKCTHLQRNYFGLVAAAGELVTDVATGDDDLVELHRRLTRLRIECEIRNSHLPVSSRYLFLFASLNSCMQPSNFVFIVHS